jgi:hypothetical protein
MILIGYFGSGRVTLAGRRDEIKIGNFELPGFFFMKFNRLALAM